MIRHEQGAGRKAGKWQGKGALVQGRFHLMLFIEMKEEKRRATR